MIPPQLIQGIGEAAGKLVKNLIGGNGLDGLFTSKEEKLAKQNELEKIESDLKIKLESQLIEWAKLNIEETKQYLLDTQDARMNNVKIQESDKASWLAKNVSYLIAIFIILIWGGLTIYLIASALKIIKTSQVDLTGIYGLYAAVTGVAMTIINFFFGTSRSSEEKSKQLNTMMNKK